MNSAAPPFDAPGTISSHKDLRVSNSCCVSALGLYTPPATLASEATAWRTCCAEAISSGPTNASAAIAESASRRVVSDIALPHFFGEIFRRPPRQRADGQRRILIRIADERRRIGHKQVLHVVRLAILVQRRHLRIVAHP